MMKIKIYLIPIFLFLPIVLLAETTDPGNYTSLIKLPVETVGGDTFGGYINMLYLTAVSLAAVLAVLKLILAGVKYMLSDVVTTKSEAKSDIKGALVGLLIIIAGVLVLNEINPSITDNNVGFPEKVKNVKLSLKTNPLKPSTTADGKNLAPKYVTNQFPGRNGGPPSSYKDLVQKFIKVEGNIVTYDIAGMCAEDTSVYITGSCKANAVDDFHDDFCYDNIGLKTGGENDSVLACKIPVAWKEESSFKVPTGVHHDYWETMCKDENGLPRDPFNFGDEFCVYYEEPAAGAF
jgi:hypothetical protein